MGQWGVKPPKAAQHKAHGGYPDTGQCVAARHRGKEQTWQDGGSKEKVVWPYLFS